MVKKGYNPNILYWKYKKKSQTQIFHTITCINHLNPNISMHIIHTVFYTFPWTQIRRICLIIKGCICWAFPLFSLPNVWFIGFIVKRKHMAVGLKDLRVKLKTSVEYNFMSVIYLSFFLFSCYKGHFGETTEWLVRLRNKDPHLRASIAAYKVFN